MQICNGLKHLTESNLGFLMVMKIYEFATLKILMSGFILVRYGRAKFRIVLSVFNMSIETALLHNV